MKHQSFPATVASIRAVYGRRLRLQQYRELMAMHSVPEIAAYLKNTAAYREHLSAIEPTMIHRGYLETVIRRAPFQRYLHFCRLEQLQHTPYFRFVLMDYEIRELFKAIQLLSNLSASYITHMHTWLVPYTSFSLETLAKADSYDGILAAVAHTPYYAALKPFVPKEGAPFAFLECEIALRTCSLHLLLEETARTMHGANRKALEDLIREQVDLINLINAYRLKSVFHTDRETLHRLMLPIQGNLPRRISKALYDAPDVDAFRQILQHTRYGRMLETQGSLPDHLQMEHAFQKLRCRTAQNALRFSDHAAVSLYAVQFLQQVEVQNLATIIEGIRYQKPVPYIESLLTLEV